MTYLSFLLYLVILPALALTLVVRPTRREWLMVGAMLLITYVWTTPWDNYLVGSGVWYYDPQLVTGIVFGWVPLEEYLFFGLQVWLSGMWLMGLRRLMGYTQTPSPNLSLLTLTLTFSGGLGMLGLNTLAQQPALFAPWRSAMPPADLAPLPFGSANYLVLIMVWAAPVILAQAWLGWADIRQHWKIWLGGWLVPALYLTAMDALAIGSGTWTIAPTQSLNIFLPGDVPIEEGVFFVATNMLITQGLILFTSATVKARLAQWIVALKRSKSANPPTPAESTLTQ